MQRRGLGIGLGKGYYNIVPKDPYIHSLSAKGVKTKVTNLSFSLNAKENNKDDKTDESDIKKRYNELVDDKEEYLSLEEFKEIEEVINSNIDGIDNYNIDYLGKRDGWLELSTEDGENWVLAPSEEEAEKVAKEVVKEQLIEETFLFNIDFIKEYIDEDNLRDILRDDVESMNYDYFNDMDEDELVKTLIASGFLNEDEYNKLKDKIDYEDISYEELEDLENELDELLEDAKEEAIEVKTEEDLENPVSYLQDIYGDMEGIKKAIELGGLNIDEASEDAVSLDGWEHYLAYYDRDYIKLKNGKVIYRID